LKIFLPDLKLTLVESVGKKTRFLEHIVKSLDLKQVEILQERAEALGQMDIYREKYDCAVARAVAIMPTLAEYLLPFVRVGGVAIAQKGESAPAEAHSADKAIYLLGGRFRQLLPVALPGVADERYLVVIDKVAATPSRYPRRVGVPSKSPLQAAPPTKDD
jgi:16S rRNA (guanine527-N7)-methyltransferase